MQFCCCSTSTRNAVEGVLFIILNYCDYRENEVLCIIQTREDNVGDTRTDYGSAYLCAE